MVYDWAKTGRDESKTPANKPASTVDFGIDLPP
jgi:hypothetical protein